MIRQKDKELELTEQKIAIEKERLMAERMKEEERIMTMKLDDLDEDTRRYYLKLRKRILEG